MDEFRFDSGGYRQIGLLKKWTQMNNTEKYQKQKKKKDTYVDVF